MQIVAFLRVSSQQIYVDSVESSATADEEEEEGGDGGGEEVGEVLEAEDIEELGGSEGENSRDAC